MNRLQGIGILCGSASNVLWSDLGNAAILWPRFTDIFYTQAKCHALLGQANDATQKFECFRIETEGILRRPRKMATSTVFETRSKNCSKGPP